MSTNKSNRKNSNPQASEEGWQFGTKSVHLGYRCDPATGALMPPINLSTTFEQKNPGIPWTEWEYIRSGNPTRYLLEQAIANLEGGKHGLAFSSGSAVTAAIGSLLEPGSHVICISDVYGGTRRYFSQILTNAGVEVTYTLMERPKEVLPGLLRAGTTKLVWIETPTNPVLFVVDVEEVVKLVKAHDPRILVVVDNTFMTPYLQRPLEWGADLVVHSATKYINGHSDVLMGLLVVNANPQCDGDDEDGLFARLKFKQNALGAVPSPFDCYMCLRGMRTLHLRMERHCRNALLVATHLTKHPNVERVLYSGLPSHPHHALVKRLTGGRGFGGIVSMVLRGDLAQTCRFSKATRVFTLAESLGGVESLIDIPALMTHAAVPLEERQALGITDTFVRLSVGIEDADDLIADLDEALRTAFS